MKRFIYILFVTVFLLGITELGFRMKGNYLTYSEKTTGKYETDWGKESENVLHIWTGDQVFNLEKGEFNYEYSINQLGFRETDLPIKDTIYKEVFVFGDSFIEGVGAPYAGTFPRYLEQLLMEDFSDYRVYNFGVSGSDPFYNFKVFELLAVLQPSHVIFSLNDGDLENYSIRGGFERFSEEEKVVIYKKGPWFNKLFQHSHLIRYAVIDLFGISPSLISSKQKSRLEEKGCREIEKCMAMARDISTLHKTKFIVFTYPFPNSVCNGEETYVHKYFTDQSFASFPAIHISKKIEERMTSGDCSSFSWPIDGHYNSSGYQLMADVFYSEVKKQYPDFFGSD